MNECHAHQHWEALMMDSRTSYHTHTVSSQPAVSTFSPVFILLLEEKSFSWRVTSLEEGGVKESREKVRPRGGCEDQRGRRREDKEDGGGGGRWTHWDTSAMCLCLRLTHRSSSSCSRTSFSRESPMPLVSYLQWSRR